MSSIAAYQQALLLAPKKGEASITTTMTFTSTTTATNTATLVIGTTLRTVGNQALASTTNLTLGLELTLILNTTHLVSGHPINITLAVQNVLATTLSLPTAAEDWRLTALAVDGDNYGYCVGAFPFAMEVFGGHLTMSNITRGAPLNVPPGLILDGCHIPVPPYDSFDSRVSERALTDITSGYVTHTGEHITFPPGHYTVVAGDRWGQLLILNFDVE